MEMWINDNEYELHYIRSSMGEKEDVRILARYLIGKWGFKQRDHDPKLERI